MNFMPTLTPTALETIDDLHVGQRVKPKAVFAQSLSWQAATIHRVMVSYEHRHGITYFLELGDIMWKPDTPLNGRVETWVVVPSSVEAA